MIEIPEAVELAAQFNETLAGKKVKQVVLTAEYFKVNLKEVYTTLFWPTLAGVMVNVTVFFIYS